MGNKYPQEEILETIFSFFFSFRSQFSGVIAEVGLTTSPMLMRLLKIASEMEHCTAQDIASHIKRDKAQINRAVTELVSKNYLTKEQNIQDKRSYLLRTTEEGHAALKLMQKAEGIMAEILRSNISEAELDAFLTTMRKIQKGAAGRK